MPTPSATPLLSLGPLLRPHLHCPQRRHLVNFYSKIDRPVPTLTLLSPSTHRPLPLRPLFHRHHLRPLPELLPPLTSPFPLPSSPSPPYRLSPSDPSSAATSPTAFTLTPSPFLSKCEPPVLSWTTTSVRKCGNRWIQKGVTQVVPVLKVFIAPTLCDRMLAIYLQSTCQP